METGGDILCNNKLEEEVFIEEKKKLPLGYLNAWD